MVKEVLVSSKALFNSPQLLWTDAGCHIERRIWPGIALLVDVRCQIVDAPSDWLTSLRVARGRSIETVRQYAYTIRSFFQYLHTEKFDWRAISDSRLRMWRNGMREHLQIRTINTHISTVVQFYKWAQDEGLVSGIVGPVEAGQPPRPIRLVPKGRYKRLVSDLLLPNTGRQIAPVPTHAEVDMMYQRLAIFDTPTKAERNCLFADWAVETGLRRFEILGLRCNDIPHRQRCLEMDLNDELHHLYVVGKGGKKRAVPVLPSLLLRTHSFILSARRKLVSELRDCHDSGSIFLSQRTGLALNRTYVSRMFSHALKSKTGRKLTLHRLRARFTSKLVQHLLHSEMKITPIADLLESTILFKAAQILGHSNIETLREYLDLELDLLDADVASAIRANSRKR